MSFSIQTNVNSMQAQENLRLNNMFQSQTITRLTSGYRINSSGDDAAGLAISNKFRSDVTELVQGVRNANDGLSTLQIIDGGLNNISKILDRLKTLATQSASATFSGSRSTLNEEFQDLLTEIDRQAANVGLGSGDDNASRNNQNIKVFIGGGSRTANSQVEVDLSTTSNVVNANQLGLEGKTLAGVTTKIDLVAGSFQTGNFLDANSSQAFTFATKNGSVTVTVAGDADGIDGEEIVRQLNAGLVGTGVNISLNADDGDIEVSSSNAFAASVAARVGTGAIVSAAVANTAAIINTGKFRNIEIGASNPGITMAAATADHDAVFTVGATTYTANIVSGDSIDTVFTKVKAALADSGVDVLRLGNEVFFQSSSDFTYSVSDAGAGGLDDLTAITSLNATDRTSASDPTADALDALTAITAAVASLGTVQGAVGTGQNRLQYAIQLAQSQITSFSAAESRIRDADVANEAANLTKAQVLQQASLAAIAQANTAPQAVLSLLRS